MDKITEILIVGTNKPIVKTIARLIDRDGIWQATSAFTMQEAIQLCTEKDFELALIGAGLTKQDEDKLSERIKSLRPGLAIIKHYGGGSGLLFAEIYEGLKKSN